MLYRSSRLRVECAEQVATLWVESAANGQNSLTTALLQELNGAIDAVRQTRAIDVLVLRSSHPHVFATGPDLDEYESLTDAPSRRLYARVGQQVLANLRDLSLNTATIAYIDGECSNAGLELALACDFRLAVARPETRIGFDCSESGLLPCWGVSQRLPRLIGPRAAIDLLLRGARLPARAAKRLGLVDHAFSPRASKTELAWFVADQQDRKRRPPPRKLWSRIRDHRLWSDVTIFQPTLRRMPAGSHLRSLIEAMRRGWQFGVAEGFSAERNGFAADAAHTGSAWRRAFARARGQQHERWRNVSVPTRIGICGLNPLGLRLVVDLLAAGGSATICSDDGPGPVRLALLQAVNQGVFNSLEADQCLKRTTFIRQVDQMPEVDLVLITGSDAVQAAHLLELDRILPPEVGLVATSPSLPLQQLTAKTHWPERIACVAFARESVSRIAVELTPTKFTDERYVAGIFRWLDRCGRRPTITQPLTTAQPIAA